MNSDRDHNINSRSRYHPSEFCTKLNYVYTTRQCDEYFEYLAELRKIIFGHNYPDRMHTETTFASNSIHYHTNYGRTLIYQVDDVSEYGIKLSQVPSRTETLITDTYYAEEHVLLTRPETSEIIPPNICHQIPTTIEEQLDTSINSLSEVTTSLLTERNFTKITRMPCDDLTSQSSPYTLPIEKEQEDYGHDFYNYEGDFKDAESLSDGIDETFAINEEFAKILEETDSVFEELGDDTIEDTCTISDEKVRRIVGIVNRHGEFMSSTLGTSTENSEETVCKTPTEQFHDEELVPSAEYVDYALHEAFDNSDFQLPSIFTNRSTTPSVENLKLESSNTDEKLDNNTHSSSPLLPEHDFSIPSLSIETQHNPTTTLAHTLEDFAAPTEALVSEDIPQSFGPGTSGNSVLVNMIQDYVKLVMEASRELNQSAREETPQEIVSVFPSSSSFSSALNASEAKENGNKLDDEKRKDIETFHRHTEKAEIGNEGTESEIKKIHENFIISSELDVSSSEACGSSDEESESNSMITVIENPGAVLRSGSDESDLESDQSGKVEFLPIAPRKSSVEEWKSVTLKNELVNNSQGEELKFFLEPEPAMRLTIVESCQDNVTKNNRLEQECQEQCAADESEPDPSCSELSSWSEEATSDADNNELHVKKTPYLENVYLCGKPPMQVETTPALERCQEPYTETILRDGETSEPDKKLTEHHEDCSNKLQKETTTSETRTEPSSLDFVPDLLDHDFSVVKRNIGSRLETVFPERSDQQDISESDFKTTISDDSVIDNYHSSDESEPTNFENNIPTVVVPDHRADATTIHSEIVYHSIASPLEKSDATYQEIGASEESSEPSSDTQLDALTIEEREKEKFQNGLTIETDLIVEFERTEELNVKKIILPIDNVTGSLQTTDAVTLTSEDSLTECHFDISYQPVEENRISNEIKVVDRIKSEPEEQTMFNSKSEEEIEAEQIFSFADSIEGNTETENDETVQEGDVEQEMAKILVKEILISVSSELEDTKPNQEQNDINLDDTMPESENQIFVVDGAVKLLNELVDLVVRESYSYIEQVASTEPPETVKITDNDEDVAEVMDSLLINFENMISEWMSTTNHLENVDENMGSNHNPPDFEEEGVILVMEKLMAAVCQELEEDEVVEVIPKGGELDEDAVNDKVEEGDEVIDRPISILETTETLLETVCNTTDHVEDILDHSPTENITDSKSDRMILNMTQDLLNTIDNVHGEEIENNNTPPTPESYHRLSVSDLDSLNVEVFDVLKFLLDVAGSVSEEFDSGESFIEIVDDVQDNLQLKFVDNIEDYTHPDEQVLEFMESLMETVNETIYVEEQESLAKISTMTTLNECCSLNVTTAADSVLESNENQFDEIRSCLQQVVQDVSLNDLTLQQTASVNELEEELESSGLSKADHLDFNIDNSFQSERDKLDGKIEIESDHHEPEDVLQTPTNEVQAVLQSIIEELSLPQHNTGDVAVFQETAIEFEEFPDYPEMNDLGVFEDSGFGEISFVNQSNYLFSGDCSNPTLLSTCLEVRDNGFKENMVQESEQDQNFEIPCGSESENSEIASKPTENNVEYVDCMHIEGEKESYKSVDTKQFSDDDATSHFVVQDDDDEEKTESYLTDEEWFDDPETVFENNSYQEENKNPMIEEDLESGALGVSTTLYLDFNSNGVFGGVILDESVVETEKMENKEVVENPENEENVSCLLSKSESLTSFAPQNTENLFGSNCVDIGPMSREYIERLVFLETHNAVSYAVELLSGMCKDLSDYVDISSPADSQPNVQSSYSASPSVFLTPDPTIMKNVADVEEQNQIESRLTENRNENSDFVDPNDDSKTSRTCSEIDSPVVYEYFEETVQTIPEHRQPATCQIDHHLENIEVGGNEVLEDKFDDTTEPSPEDYAMCSKTLSIIKESCNHVESRSIPRETDLEPSSFSSLQNCITHQNAPQMPSSDMLNTKHELDVTNEAVNVLHHLSTGIYSRTLMNEISDDCDNTNGSKIKHLNETKTDKHAELESSTPTSSFGTDQLVISLDVTSPNASILGSSNYSVHTDTNVQVPTNFSLPVETSSPESSLTSLERPSTSLVLEEVSHFLATACVVALAFVSPSESPSPSFNPDIIEDASKYFSEEPGSEDDIN